MRSSRYKYSYDSILSKVQFFLGFTHLLQFQPFPFVKLEPNNNFYISQYIQTDNIQYLPKDGILSETKSTIFKEKINPIVVTLDTSEWNSNLDDDLRNIRPEYNRLLFDRMTECIQSTKQESVIQDDNNTIKNIKSTITDFEIDNTIISDIIMSKELFERIGHDLKTSNVNVYHKFDGLPDDYIYCFRHMCLVMPELTDKLITINENDNQHVYSYVNYYNVDNHINHQEIDGKYLAFKIKLE